MKPTPFAHGKDLEPIPFLLEHCALAKQLKEKGLDWHPHVGCFVWDETGFIEVSSPFPNRIYFILNCNHFLKLFKTIETMKDRLAWLPTWHQAKLICKKLDICQTEINDALCSTEPPEIGADSMVLYMLILQKL